MMLDEEVIKLVKEHFEEDWDENDGWEYSGNFDAFVKFAQEIYDKAYDDGCYETSYFTGYTGLFGEPQ